MVRNWFGKFRFFLLLTLLSMMMIQLSPIGLGDNYERFRYVIIGLTGVLFLLSWDLKAVFSIKIFRYFFFVILGEAILLSIVFAVGGNVNWRPFVDLLMAWGFVLIALMRITTRQYLLILNLFIWGTLYIGVSCIFTYGTGFVINDLYMPIPKNQIAPILAISCLIAFFVGNHVQRVSQKFYYWGIAFLLFACICVFRARANIVALALGLLIYFVFYKRDVRVLFLGIGVGIVVFVFSPLGLFVYNALFANYDISDLNSVSAGRTDTYLVSLDFILDNLLWGNLALEKGRLGGGIVHNYGLYTLENYGIIGGGLLILFYIKLWVNILRNNISQSQIGVYSIGSIVFIVPLVVSLFEYTYPYSPGSAVFMAYFCLGQYFRRRSTI